MARAASMCRVGKARGVGADLARRGMVACRHGYVVHLVWLCGDVWRARVGCDVGVGVGWLGGASSVELEWRGLEARDGAERWLHHEVVVDLSSPVGARGLRLGAMVVRGLGRHSSGPCWHGARFGVGAHAVFGGPPVHHQRICCSLWRKG